MINPQFLPVILSREFVVSILITVMSCTEAPKWTETPGEVFNIVDNEGGATLGYSPNSGVMINTRNGLAFKDLNKNGELDNYEDWRLSVEERAKDLATRMSIEQIAGLMLCSNCQSMPTGSRGRFRGTYGGKSIRESGAAPSYLPDEQKKFLTEDNRYDFGFGLNRTGMINDERSGKYKKN